MATLPVDDRDLDDAALWAVIDAAAATATATSTTSPTTTTTTARRFHSPLTLTRPNFRTPPPSKFDTFRRPEKFHRSSSPYISELANISPVVEHRVSSEDKENFTHCLSGRFPTVSLFKDYQDAAMAVLDKSDYTMISGNPFIRKSGWRKIAFYFNVSFEIRDKTIEFDDNRNVQRAEFVVRAYMQGGRFSDGWGSCERREKKFMKPNNDIPSTAETRAKNKACQDLIGIGQYRHVASHSHSPSPR